MRKKRVKSRIYLKLVNELNKSMEERENMSNQMKNKIERMNAATFIRI